MSPDGASVCAVSSHSAGSVLWDDGGVHPLRATAALRPTATATTADARLRRRAAGVVDRDMDMLLGSGGAGVGWRALDPGGGHGRAVDLLPGKAEGVGVEHDEVCEIADPDVAGVVVAMVHVGGARCVCS